MFFMLFNYYYYYFIKSVTTFFHWKLIEEKKEVAFSRNKEKKNTMNTFTKECLYFGTDPAYFAKAHGKFDYVNLDTVEYGEPLKKKPATRRLMAEENKDLVMPSIPCSDLKIEHYGPETLPPDTEVPSQLKSPLIKVPEDSKEIAFTGVRSGVRSGLIPIDGKWYRLKGCGNNDQGFPTRDIVSSGKPTGEKEIRGCAYDYTTSREIIWTDKITTALAEKDANLKCANRSVPGWWVYSIPDAPFPSIPRCCGVFETYGDRRLCTHLLHGLEKLLPVLFPGDTFKKQEASIMPLFDGSRVTGDQNDPITATHIALLCELPCVNAAKAPLEVPSLLSTGIPFPENYSIDSRWKPLWNQFSDDLVRACKSSSSAKIPLGYIYDRLGAEAGAILRILHDKKISWGTFRDDLATHCNAHGNNVVVLPPAKDGEDNAWWIAPLDFDMSFAKSEHWDKESFESEIVPLEISSMKFTIGGDSESNSGVSEGALALPAPLSVLVCALRDTAVSGFTRGYEGSEKLNIECSPSDIEKAKGIIGLALIITANIIS